MSIPKKGTRKITVDNVDYRWLVSPGYEIGLGIVVESSELSDSRMITYVDHGNTVSPSLFRVAIKNAISKGWQPHEQGNRLEGILEREPNVTHNYSQPHNIP